MTTEQYLRHSAAALNALADRLDGAPVRGLLDRAGDATWRGDVANEFRSTVVALDGQLRQAIEELRARAARSIWEADQIAAAEAARRVLEAQQRAERQAAAEARSRPPAPAVPAPREVLR